MTCVGLVVGVSLVNGIDLCNVLRSRYVNIRPAMKKVSRFTSIQISSMTPAG